MAYSSFGGTGRVASTPTTINVNIPSTPAGFGTTSSAARNTVHVSFRPTPVTVPASSSGLSATSHLLSTPAPSSLPIPPPSALMTGGNRSYPSLMTPAPASSSASMLNNPAFTTPLPSSYGSAVGQSAAAPLATPSSAASSVGNTGKLESDLATLQQSIQRLNTRIASQFPGVASSHLHSGGGGSVGGDVSFELQTAMSAIDQKLSGKKSSKKSSLRKPTSGDVDNGVPALPDPSCKYTLAFVACNRVGSIGNCVCVLG